MARLRLERRKERPTRTTFAGDWNGEKFLPTRITTGVVATKGIWLTRITSCVVGTEKKLADRNYVVYAVRTIPTRINFLRNVV